MAFSQTFINNNFDWTTDENMGYNSVICDCSNNNINIILPKHGSTPIYIIRVDNNEQNLLTLSTIEGQTIRSVNTLDIPILKICLLNLYGTNWNCLRIAYT